MYIRFVMRKKTREEQKIGFFLFYFEFLQFLFISGLIWSEVKQLWDVGLQEYIHDMWNVIDFITNSLYVATVALRVVSYFQVSWNKANFLLKSSGLRSSTKCHNFDVLSSLEKIRIDFIFLHWLFNFFAISTLRRFKKKWHSIRSQRHCHVRSGTHGIPCWYRRGSSVRPTFSVPWNSCTYFRWIRISDPYKYHCPEWWLTSWSSSSCTCSSYSPLVVA